MKANHRSAYKRLTSRIAKLELRKDGMWSRKRFYPKCKFCGITNVEASILGKHYKYCSFSGLDKEIAYYEKLRDEQKGGSNVIK